MAYEVVRVAYGATGSRTVDSTYGSWLTVRSKLGIGPRPLNALKTEFSFLTEIFPFFTEISTVLHRNFPVLSEFTLFTEFAPFLFMFKEKSSWRML